MLHPAVFELLYETAEQEGIPFTLESIGRHTSTDADAVHNSRAGIPTGLVSVPTRYVHSPVEMISLSDLDATARLLAAFAQRVQPGMSFERA
jgi:endoglucanase